MSNKTLERGMMALRFASAFVRASASVTTGNVISIGYVGLRNIEEYGETLYRRTLLSEGMPNLVEN